MKLTAIVPWFGGKRTMAPRIVAELGEHAYYFEACAGSMAVLFAKEPSSHEAVCDLHGLLTNLAWVVQDEEKSVQLYHKLAQAMYHDDIFAESREQIELCVGEYSPNIRARLVNVAMAYHYFIASWMGRNGVAGTAKINYTIATRWTAGGGSGPLRFRNAIESIPAWCERLRNVHILRRDLFEVLPNIEDAKGVSIYADPPYLKEGGQYLHGFKVEDHERLAVELRRFEKARVVVSYYASPMLVKLYPEWIVVDCSRQKHTSVQNRRGIGKGSVSAPEVLLINGPSLTSVPAADAGELFA